MSSVKVALRIRPLSAKERLNCNRKCVSVLSNGNTPQIILHPDRKFTFDYIFDDDSSQKEVYDTCVKPLLHNFIDGFNATILAYGQTGSGKTYSMGTGLENEMNFENQGIIPRAIYELFSILKKKNSLEYKYKLSVTYLELYNEDLNDLLNPKIKQISNNNINPSQGGVNANTVTLQIREDANGIINWYGVSEVEIESPEDLLSLLEKGSLIRSTGSTDMNMSSSRSHAIFSINLKQEILQEEDNLKNENNNEINNDDIITNDKEYNDENKNNITMNENNIENNNKKDDDKKEKWICLSSKFHFVDLAGSERLKRTGAIGERVKEGITINQGLFALGNVINALTDESHPDRHVPYRDSKLTRLLQDSLGGNSKTLMLSCISCCELDYNESLNTLRYANRARMIKNEAIINRNYRNTDIDYQEFIRMKEEIARLKNELLKAKSNNKNNENNNSDENDETEVENNIDDENGIENQADNDIFDIKDRKKQNDLLREKILNQQCEIEQLNLKINFYESQMCDLKNEIVKAEVERDSLVLNLKLSNYESDDIKGEIRKKIDRILGNAISTNNIDDDNNDNDDNNNNDKYENNKEDKKEFIENEFVESYIRKIENLKEKCMNLEKDLNIQYLINNQSLSKFSMYHDIIMGIDECYSQKKIVPVMDKAREEIQKQIEIVEKKKRDVKIKKETSINKKDDEEVFLLLYINKFYILNFG
ncbi:kinesin-domain-containing protein [Piromyces finnis]|uniref:Kinesin-like protein n=1 Tax=Piromyces finnis TaxID=1754191 RepID=A0A1Y1UUF4_9FUNG|nr:kinesin-domain-containing protein [Piromyces finnis]|eukprot:ORX41636.1 kinesin-domain-containing protein [Piromyces finnis]